jgi:hypothetical protein
MLKYLNNALAESWQPVRANAGFDPAIIEREDHDQAS